MTISSPAKSAVSLEQFAVDHGISRTLVYAMFKNGTGPAVLRAGRRVLVTTEAAAAWREAQTKRVQP
jgi:hypothetical protein